MAQFEKLLGLNPTGWQGRVKEGAYTAPDGVRIAFHFEEVGRDTPLRTKKFSFNGLDGSYIQQNGFDAREYPMRCIFSGEDHDLAATAFEALLLQIGIGQLEHPLYGTISVVPVGSVGRRNDLIRAANQSVVEITFSTTLASVYPAAESFPANEIAAAVAAFQVASAQQFESSLTLDTEVQRASTKATIRKALGEVRQALEAVSSQTAASRRAFDENFRLVNEGIDVLIGSPLLLAEQISGLILAPARAAAGITSRLEGYANLAERLFKLSDGRSDKVDDGAGNGGPGAPSGAILREVVRVRNDFHIADLCAMSAVAGATLSTVNNDFSSRPEAQGAAVDVLTQTGAVVDWREDRLENLLEIERTGGGAYQAMQDASAKAGGYLVQLSFELLPERSLITERARTFVDMCAELYRSVDDADLQFFIDSNRLTGSEILEIPKGRKIVWYA